MILKGKGYSYIWNIFATKRQLNNITFIRIYISVTINQPLQENRKVFYPYFTVLNKIFGGCSYGAPSKTHLSTNSKSINLFSHLLLYKGSRESGPGK